MWKKWQLFHATDFQSLMYPCFIFSSMLGIFPYKINGSTFEISKRRYILSTIIICVVCIYELVLLYMIDIAGMIKFKDITKTLERNCFYMLTNFIAVVTYIFSGPRMHLLQTIMDISSKLPFNSYKNLSRLIHAKDIFGFFFLIALITFYYVNLDANNWHKLFTPYLILLTFQVDMLYMNCVHVLKACFKRINDNLINLRQHIVNDESHLPSIYHKHRNLLLMELKTLKKQHLAISDTIQMLNMVFSLQLLATIVLTFALLTFQLYFYIIHWQAGILMNKIRGVVFDLFSLMCMTYHAIKMISIIWICETGKVQAIKIGITVHDLLNNSSDKQINDEVIKKMKLYFHTCLKIFRLLM